MAMQSKPIPLGTKFGNWTTIGPRTPGPYRGHFTFKCRCVCGVEKVVLYNTLANGRSTSCGCKAREALTTHGHFARWRRKRLLLMAGHEDKVL